MIISDIFKTSGKTTATHKYANYLNTSIDFASELANFQQTESKMRYKNFQPIPRFQSQLQSSLDKSPFRHKKEAQTVNNFKEKYFAERIENERLLN